MKYFSSIISSCLGNVLEWYDFGLFSIFSSLFARLFFPETDKQTALIATFGIFAVGFLCRPLGALIFGYLGDKTGRARTLRLSILMITLPTLLIGVLPTYQQAGLLAPVLLMLIRMWQGISIGGEFSGNMIYLAETAPAKYRATITSFASVGANIGILLAAVAGILANQLMTETSLAAWGWRLPYLISGALCMLIYLFRLRIKETVVFDYLKQKNLIANNPLQAVFTEYRTSFLRILGLVCMGSTFYYFCFIYIPVFLTQTTHISASRTSLLLSVYLAAMIVLIPFAGRLCDKIGRRKMLLINAAIVMLVVIPGFYFLQSGIMTVFIIILGLFTLASSLEQGTTLTAVVENFPPPARYTGIALSYNIGNGLLGGTVPIVCEWLTSRTHFILAPAAYIATCAAMTLTVAYFFIPETKNKSLI